MAALWFHGDLGAIIAPPLPTSLNMRPRKRSRKPDNGSPESGVSGRAIQDPPRGVGQRRFSVSVVGSIQTHPTPTHGQQIAQFGLEDKLRITIERAQNERRSNAMELYKFQCRKSENLRRQQRRGFIGINWRKGFKSRVKKGGCGGHRLHIR